MGRLLKHLTTATIANCKAARGALLEDETADPSSIVVLENGTDLDRFLGLPAVPPGPHCVGVVANLRPVKGLDIFLEACRQLAPRHPDARFTIAGEGECRHFLERAAARAGIADRFSLPGAVADIPRFLARLHVAVLSSHAEGMSNALLEYMAAARPIVATAVGAAPEQIIDGVHGVLVPPGDPTRLATAIDQLLRDPGRSQRLGAAARRRAQQMFSRAAMVHRFEAFYETLCRKKEHRL
jgi:glycosyltransferase involved in cell wall biosynthesis